MEVLQELVSTSYEEFVPYYEEHKHLTTISKIIYHMIYYDDTIDVINKLQYLYQKDPSFTFMPFHLDIAIRNGNLRICKYLLSNRLITNYKGSPLNVAAISGAVDIIDYLICDYNISIDEPNNFFTPLAATIMFNQISAFDVLLKYGANPQLALYALLYCKLNTIYYITHLIAYGANIDAPISKDKTLLQILLEREDKYSCQDLIIFLQDHTST